MDNLFKVVNCEELADYVVADQDFEEGQFLFMEKPLMSFPINSRRLEDLDEISCVGCFKVMTSQPMFCSKCLLPVCCYSCSQEENHSALECKLFAETEIEPTEADFGFIEFVRVLLSKEVFPERYQNFDLFASDLSPFGQKFSALAEKESRAIWTYVTERFEMEVTLAEVLKVWTTLKVNSFIVKSEDDDMTTYRGHVVYKLACKFSHSCSPNLEWHLKKTENKDGTYEWCFSVISSKAIRKGEIMSIAYSRAGFSYGTGYRQRDYQASLPFACLCSRCVDPTEGGTFFSSPKCPKCKRGNLLPEKPLASLTCTWKCSNCIFLKNGYRIEKRVSKCEGSVQRLIHGGSASLDSLDAFIKKNSGRKFHPNHFLIFQSSMHWLLTSDFTEGLIDQSEKSDQLFKTIMNRYSRCLGLTIKFLHSINIVELEMMAMNSVAAFIFKSRDCVAIDDSNLDYRFKIRFAKKLLYHLSRARFWMKRQQQFHCTLDTLYSLWIHRLERFSEENPIYQLQMEEFTLSQLRLLFK